MLKIFGQKSKSKWLVLIMVVLGLGLFFNVQHARADVLDWMGLIGNITAAPLFLILGALIQGIAWFIGQVLTVITDILFSVAKYDNFVNNQVVLTGWPVVRDFCNMFFILILLVIAFATILRIENYGLKRLLPRLVIMAVLINFSKTICGLLIDFSQVIMLTLVNAWGTAGGGNLYTAFGIGKIFEIRTAVGLSLGIEKDINAMTLFGSLLLGLIILIISGIIISIFTIILAFRIVYFWILIIFSPLAFIASVLPGRSASLFSQWLGQFTNYLIVGPVMAFFLWLALSTVGQVKYAGSDFNIKETGSSSETTETTISAALTTAGSKENLTKFIVSCCLLLGGLMAAQQLGVAGGKAAGGALGYIQRGGWAGKKAGEFLQGFRESRKRKIAAAGGPAAQRMGGRLFGLFSGIQQVAALPHRAAIGAAKAMPPVKQVFKITDYLKQTYRERVKNIGDARKKKMKDRQTLLDAERTGVYKKKELLEYQFDYPSHKYYRKDDWDKKTDKPKIGVREAGSFEADPDTHMNYDLSDWEKDKDGNLTGLNKTAKGLRSVGTENVDYYHDEKTDKYYDTKDWDYKSKKPKKGAKELATFEKEYGYQDGKYYKQEDWDKEGKKPIKGAEAKKEEPGKVGFWGKMAQSIWAQIDKGESLAVAFRNSEQNSRAAVEQKKMEHLDKTQLANIMADVSTSNDQRIASAIILAIQKGFQDAGQVALAKNVIAGNGPLLKQFNDGINKGQAHLNFDFDKDKDKDSFNKLVARGELDIAKQESEAYQDEKFLKAMKGALGKEFAEKIVSASKQSADHRDKVMNGLEKIFDRDKGIDKKDIAIERKVFAQISGDLGKAMWDYTLGKINYEAVGELIKSAKPDHYGKIDAKKLATDRTLLETVAKNSTFGQLRSVHRKGDAPDLIRVVIERINKLDTIGLSEAEQKSIGKIKGDPELASYLV